MRIAYAGTLPPHPGGSAVLGGDVLAGLARRGHAIAAVAPITAEALAAGDPLAQAPFAVTRYLIPAFECSANHPASEAFRAAERDGIARGLAPLLAAGGVDLILAGRETFALHVPALAHRFALPYVVLAQGGTLWGLTGGNYPPELRRALVDGLAGAARVIGVARHLAAHLRGLGLERVDIVANAVDPGVFTPGPRDPALLRDLALGGSEVIAVHLSNLKDLKRPLDLARAAIAAMRRDPRLRLLVVGDGPGRALIEAEGTRAGLGARFRFTGWVPRAAVPRYLRLADMVVMPSEIEALALAYLETQACGRVLIASDIAAAREVCRDGETALLFPPGDVAALTACILRVAGDAGLRAAIGARARAFAETHTLEAALDAYERILAAAASP